jgi:predicted ATP-dependent endonuclease of OLD family
VRLIKAKVSGYRRLADNCQLNLDADPLCIVGPNAAGKSSFLDALVHLNDDQPFEQTEKTRVPGGKTLEPFIEARFVLDEHELELMKQIPEAVEVRQFLVKKSSAWPERHFSADPYPSRDLTKRREVQAQLELLAEIGWPEQVQGVEESLETPPDPLVGPLFTTALDRASGDDQRLEEEAGDFDALSQHIGPILQQIGQRIEAEAGGDPYDGPDWPEFPEALIGLPEELAALATLEREEHPLRKVVRALEGRVPEFLKFDDRARKLETKYDLSGEEPEQGLGIHNFLALAGTSWAEAVEVVQRDDPGWTKTYIEKRDGELKERAALTWGQSDIEVTIGLNASILSILLSMQAHDFIGFDDHSDGLKAFMALRAFVSQSDSEQGEIKPIVLIDEAELHLHYDAQADLVCVFEEQEEAAQIIYTTHSAGCLPRDLGQGVRAIVPKTEEKEGKTIQKDHSEAINRFWTKGRGFSPLLLAMGAGAFAFSATQYAVITEGMSDALLLPTLIREATGENRLRYQAVPSFAEATADEIKRFDLIAGRIAFLADGDEGGRNHAQQLIDNGISEDQILYLGDDPDSELSIEDLLVKSVYLKAVNDELGAWVGLEYPADELPDKGRSKAVKDWCAEQKGHNGKPVEISKVDIAQRVLDQRSSNTKLLAKAPTVKKVHEKIMGVFEGAPERMKQLRERAAEAAPPSVEPEPE